MTSLALFGGDAVRRAPFPRYNPIGEAEKRAVLEVMESGVLSEYLGTWSPEFYGGPRVRKLEREWEAYFGVRHAVSLNSATSALSAAVGATGVGPGDEVIVSPYTMSASVACVLICNAIPVFADILPDTFCLDPEAIRRLITPRTRAIVVVDLFGHPFEAKEIMGMAREHDLTVIEDAAQAYGAMYDGHPAGTLADIGVFSLNYHKTIHSGEGGICVTNAEKLAERIQLIRNHAEVVVKDKGVQNLVNMIGFNLRMGEIEAAIASEQLKKVSAFAANRVELASYLTERLKKLPGITPPVVRPGARHGYYGYVVRYDASHTGVPRGTFVQALRAEGIPTGEGYVEPIYLQPIYQQRIAYGTVGCPFTCPYYGGSVDYAKGICPVAERMHEQEVVTHALIYKGVSREDLDDIVRAYEKVLAGVSVLASRGEIPARLGERQATS
jgi:perosamine synthetase